MKKESFVKEHYHHGSLHDALIGAAVQRLQQDGIAKLSLRALAADVGVSPTAVYRHFEDKSALLAAIACDGFVGLTQNMHKYLGHEPCDALSALKRIGIGYVDYAIHHPAHYRLMFGQRMVERARYPDLYQASNTSFAMLRDTIKRGIDEQMFRDLPLDVMTMTAWSLVHGMAMLTIDGCLVRPPNQSDALMAIANQVQDTLAHGLLRSPSL
ncbi:MAG: TetR/AcrR family transcriptional regulator [Moraxellaceae bacterium]|nr:TetR/AcrR family transcriptional regulator [Pseudomonadales bacterium]MCB1673820.1 TetR/AcrR family transcriptional regulator [Pseudomonadales bacterium]MCP5173966.1 TetR/AcrR family transcriptional regulator [Moraxellaceae bacterium]MCP5177992.1 TetR/AcrR family transcriptional regulator [Moraxellaceae bacterium]